MRPRWVASACSAERVICARVASTRIGIAGDEVTLERVSRFVLAEAPLELADLTQYRGTVAGQPQREQRIEWPQHDHQIAGAHLFVHEGARQFPDPSGRFRGDVILVKEEREHPRPRARRRGAFVVSRLNGGKRGGGIGPAIGLHEANTLQRHGCGAFDQADILNPQIVDRTAA